MAKADGSGHQPQRIINATPAGPRRTDWDFNLKETKKEYGKESTGLCELLHEAEI